MSLAVLERPLTAKGLQTPIHSWPSTATIDFSLGQQPRGMQALQTGLIRFCHDSEMDYSWLQGVLVTSGCVHKARQVIAQTDAQERP